MSIIPTVEKYKVTAFSGFTSGCVEFPFSRDGFTVSIYQFTSPVDELLLDESELLCPQFSAEKRDRLFKQRAVQVKLPVVEYMYTGHDMSGYYPPDVCQAIAKTKKYAEDNAYTFCPYKDLPEDHVNLRCVLITKVLVPVKDEAVEVKDEAVEVKDEAVKPKAKSSGKAKKDVVQKETEVKDVEEVVDSLLSKASTEDQEDQPDEEMVDNSQPEVTAL